MEQFKPCCFTKFPLWNSSTDAAQRAAHSREIGLRGAISLAQTLEMWAPGWAANPGVRYRSVPCLQRLLLITTCYSFVGGRSENFFIQSLLFGEFDLEKQNDPMIRLTRFRFLDSALDGSEFCDRSCKPALPRRAHQIAATCPRKKAFSSMMTLAIVPTE